VLLNSPYGPDEVWSYLPKKSAGTADRKETETFCVGRATKWPIDRHGRPHQSIMQTGFFAITTFSPWRRLFKKIKNAIQKTYGKRGEAVVQKKFQALWTVPSLICMR